MKVRKGGRKEAKGGRKKEEKEGRKCFLTRISAWSASFNFLLSGFPHL